MNEPATRMLVIAPEPFFTPRGTPFSVYHRTLIACELGAEVDLLTYGEGEDVDIPGARIVRIPRIPFLEPVGAGPSLKKLFLDLFMIPWAIGLLVKKRYGVVHAHEESVFWGFALKPLFRFRLVYDMHSSLPEQLSNFGFTESRILIRIFEILESLALKSADAVVTICPEVGEYASARMRDPSRHFLIENSIFEDIRYTRGDGDPDPPPAPSLPGDRPIVAYVGSFEPYQGLELLMRAFVGVRRAMPEAFLVLVGGTPEQVRSHREIALKLGLEGHCAFPGRVPPSQVKEYYARASVLTSPRTEGTNTPLKIYEQLASGVPLVATRILSHTQVLDDRICFLVDPDPESMAKGLLEALGHSEKREAVVTAAQRHYRRHWSRPAYKEKVRSLLGAIS